MNSKDTPDAQISKAPTLETGLTRILEARHHDPFEVLGRHHDDGKECFRVFLPQAESVHLGEDGPPFTRISGTDLFEARIPIGNAVP
ncbi:MAG TPA: hypothetical protein DCY52_11520, partial [Methylococcaceae bacterium]|nr:hypothetical protein [Methylococcaceae bacterium]